MPIYTNQSTQWLTYRTHFTPVYICKSASTWLLEHMHRGSEIWRKLCICKSTEARSCMYASKVSIIYNSTKGYSYIWRRAITNLPKSVFTSFVLDSREQTSIIFWLNITTLLGRWHFEVHFLYETRILIQIELKFVPNGSINSKSGLVLRKVWCWTSDSYYIYHCWPSLDDVYMSLDLVEWSHVGPYTKVTQLIGLTSLQLFKL